MLAVAGVLALLGLRLFDRPTVTVGFGGRHGLLRVATTGFGTRVTSLDATVGGRPVPLEPTSGGYAPRTLLPEGALIDIRAEATPPSWLQWLYGPGVADSTTIHAPSALPSTRVAVTTEPGSVEVSFDRPVSVVSYAPPGRSARVLRLSAPRSTVTVPVPADSTAGRLRLAATPFGWESLPERSSEITWFVEADPHEAAVLADPAPGSATAVADSAITLRFSEPVADVFSSSSTRPHISPAVAGSWSEPGPDELVFTPEGLGFGPATKVTVSFGRPVVALGGHGRAPAAGTSFSFETAPASTVRLDQLLAQLHYLPLDFVPAPGQSVPGTLSAQVAALSHPPKGTFDWRWSTTPASLSEQWSVGSPNELLRGALLAFDSVSEANYDGYSLDDETVAQLAGPGLWDRLVGAALHDRVDPAPYSYVYVTKTLPETLTLWQDGSVVLTSPANTGIAGLATPDGTFPIYARFTEAYMSGHNPNGSYYHDLVHWINYFNGGDAVHGFPRASYGFPQSLGCVELPIPTAEVVFGHLSIGDLVTVAA